MKDNGMRGRVVALRNIQSQMDVCVCVCVFLPSQARSKDNLLLALAERAITLHCIKDQGLILVYINIP